MLLVAIGTDGSAFTGAEWIDKVKAAAEKTFLLYNLGDRLTNGSMERQKAAQMAFNAKFQMEANADKAKGDARTMPVEVPETMKLLVIGNSFGNDCSIAHLYEMLKEVGVKDLVIGILYYSGCPYSKHVDFALQDQPVYKYYKNTTGKFATRSKVTFDASVADEQWTHIMMLHGWIGHPSYFAPVPWQDLLLAYVRRTNPDAWYGYDMTWVVRSDGKLSSSDAKSYEKYHGSDQTRMINGLVETTKTYVETEPRFKFIAPVGTAILNARSSFLENGIYRDGLSHLNKGVGRYTAAMTVCCTLTGVDPDKIAYAPDSLISQLPEGLNKDAPGMKETLVKIAKESVKNALAKPYEATPSQYKTAP